MRDFWLLLILYISLASESGGLRAVAAENAIQEYLVLGTVVWIEPTAALILIRQQNLFGRLHFQVKSYRAKQPSALNGLQPGDKIVAEVSTKDHMLHRLRQSQALRARTRSN
jgi:hypothetical protein